MVPTFTLKLTPKEAVAQQRELTSLVDLSPMQGEISLIGGCDISYNRFSDECYAAIVLLDYQRMEVVGHAVARAKMTFPYVPGLLSYRELPAILRCWDILPMRPQVVCLDGQGIAHMRGLGIASHFGVLPQVQSFSGNGQLQPSQNESGKPSATMGVGKSVLVGKFDEPGPLRGDFSPMYYQGRQVGVALRTKDRVKPVYVSPGNGMSLADARRIALHCARGYRIPEPTRQAHLLANAARRGEVQTGSWLK